MQRSRVYRDGRLVGTDVPGRELMDALRDPEAAVWVDLLRPDAAELDKIRATLGLHPLATEDALEGHQRPKLDRYRHHLFLAAYAIHLPADADELVSCEIDAFVTENALVTVRMSDEVDLGAVPSRWDTNAQLAGHGVPFLLHGLLDVLADGYLAAAGTLDGRLDDLEDDLFGDPDARTGLQRRIFDVRRAISRLRRVVVPMRSVLDTYLGRDLSTEDPMAPFFRDVEDHVRRAVEWTDAQREQATSILDTNLNLASNRMNTVMKTLTGWAAIIAVPTAITGFFGQNVPFPGFGHVDGFVFSIISIVAISVALYFLLRARDWL